MPFIPGTAPSQPPRQTTLHGGFGLTTLVLKPVNTEIINGQPTQVPLTTDSDIDFNSCSQHDRTQFTATLSNLDSGTLVGQVQFTVPNSINRIALLGGVGDNLIEVDPSVQLGMLLYGGPGHNILMAGSGNDVLVGGSGTSILEGGTGERRALRRRHPGRLRVI